MTPQPLQRIRHIKGYKHPPGTLFVTRGTLLGNKHRIEKVPPPNWSGYSVDSFGFDDKISAARYAVSAYRADMEIVRRDSLAIYAALMKLVWEAPFVACACEIGAPCHRDVLIELATEWAASVGLATAQQAES